MCHVTYLYFSVTTKPRGLGDLVVTHFLLVQRVQGSIPWSPSGEHLRFNSQASTLADKQCWLWAVWLQQTDRIM